jgi:hypothetical protein
MSIETILTCPLGSKCEEIKDNKLHRCAWSIELDGTNPNNGETVKERGCAMAWMPILLIENSKQQRSTASAVESFRNEMVSGNALLAGSVKQFLIPNP